MNILTGNTDTRMVASRATMSEMTARVPITASSCFPGFQSSNSGSTACCSSFAESMVVVVVDVCWFCRAGGTAVDPDGGVTGSDFGVICVIGAALVSAMTSS